MKTVQKFAWLLKLVLVILILPASWALAQDVDEVADPTVTEEADAPVVVDGIARMRTDDGGFVMGDPDAPITIVEFADFACPHCQDYRETVDQLIETYVATGQAQFEFRTFPTAGGELTVFAAQLAECADAQQPGAFWFAHDLFYDLAIEGQYDPKMGRVLAARLELDYGQMLSCVTTARQIQIDFELGEQGGVRGTPAVMVRYGDGAMSYITYEDQTYNQGGVPFEVLASVIEAAQPE